MDAVTVVVVTWNGAHLLSECLDSLRAQTVAHHVLVVDNGSTDATLDLLAGSYPEVEVLALPANTGFAGGAQAGLDAVGTAFTALLNNDAVAEPGWLAALLAELGEHPGAAAATSRLLLTSSGLVNNAGGALTPLGVGYDRGYGAPDGAPYDVGVQVAAFCGGACLLRTAPVRQVGGLAREFFLYYEDTDLSWRLRRAGYSIHYVPASVVHHRHSATSDQASETFAFYNQRNQLLMLIRNAPAWLVAVNVARFAAITLARLLRPGQVVAARPRHRVRVLGAVVRTLPRTLAQRRAVGRGAVVSRGRFRRDWLGTPQRPIEQ